MKLSEAIRLGATLKPQAFGDYYVGNASCALGAACDAVGANPSAVSLPFNWDISLNKMSKLPCPSCEIHTGECIVPHLNDTHRWSRERIADWVATIEAEQTESAEISGAVHA